MAPLPLWNCIYVGQYLRCGFFQFKYYFTQNCNTSSFFWPSPSLLSSFYILTGMSVNMYTEWLMVIL